MEMRAAPALGLHDPLDPCRRHPEPGESLVDIGPPVGDRLGVRRDRNGEAGDRQDEPQRAHSSRALPMMSAPSVTPK